MDSIEPLPQIPFDKLPRDSQQLNLVVCAVVTWLVGGLFVGLRFYTRAKILSVLGAADWCILASWVLALGVTASSIEQVYRGTGRHIWDVDVFQLGSALRAAWYGIVFYGLTVCLIKVSILLLYFTFFTVGWAWWASRVVMGFVVISNVWTIGTVFTACIPLDAYWDFTKAEGAFCQSNQIWWFNNGLHVATDFLIFALPLPVVWSLRMPWRQKLALVGLFALGFFVCIIAVVRLVLLVNTDRSFDSDLTWNAAANIYWTNVEVNLAIACACAVTLKPLLMRRFPRAFAFDSGVAAAAAVQANSTSSPPTVGTRKTRTECRDVPRIDSWIDFPGKLDSFDFEDVKAGNEGKGRVRGEIGAESRRASKASVRDIESIGAEGSETEREGDDGRRWNGVDGSEARVGNTKRSS